jgi:L-ascorbate metabolism protein UlaG (beta-lactamase superfamily)
MSEALYLRQDIQVEPLVDQWYAWSHLLAPATLARNITHRHFKIMDSYLNAPDIHASAVKNPKMLGGPFVDHGGKRTDEIRALRHRTKESRAREIELSTALAELDELLATAADGHSLHPLYERVPQPLRGLVELTYDLRNNASFRLIEPLLYRSDRFNPAGQSLMLSVTSGDDRPFFMSTPRLPSPGFVQLPWRFDDPRVDMLFRLKHDPRPWTWIRESLDIGEQDADLVRSFFTATAPRPYVAYAGPGVRWRYFGHACILVETKDVAILLDPVLSYTYESGISRYTYLDLPDRIDYVLITHNHQDHILLETLLQIRHKVDRIVVPRNGSGALQDPSLLLALRHAGFRNVQELGELESIEEGRVAITGVPFLGEHCDLAVTTKLAYAVRFGREQILFAADSCNLEPQLYERIHSFIGDVNTLFLGMECDGGPLSWLYGPLLLRPLGRSRDQSRRLSGSDYAQAIDLVERVRCRNVYVYAMGQEPWLNYVMSIKYTDQSRPIVESNKLVDACTARGLDAERLFGEREIMLDPVEAAAV